MLKYTNVELELPTDIDQMRLFQQGIRGGISMISNRYAKANNKYMGDKYDPTKPSSFIVYFDKTNLYGWALSQKTTYTRNFKWMSETELQNWNNHPCILEVDLEYPKELHDLRNDYPLAPEQVVVNKVPKLIPNLNDKTKYVLHYANLKQYLSFGMKLTKVHRGMKFDESDFMKKYIDLNTALRAKAKSEFHKDFYKLMNIQYTANVLKTFLREVTSVL